MESGTGSELPNDRGAACLKSKHLVGGGRKPRKEFKASLGHRRPCPKKLKEITSHSQGVCCPFMSLLDPTHNGDNVNAPGKRERKEGWGLKLIPEDGGLACCSLQTGSRQEGLSLKFP